jgi:D-inositol-3-phosphate glycosyltransferase
MMFHTLGAIKNSIGIGEDESDLRIVTEGRLANESDLVIATTEQEKLALKHFYEVPAGKISVIPCGVNLDLFKPMDKSLARRNLDFGGGKIILFVGRVERLKGIDKIIQALPLLSGEKPKLIIVGEDGNRKGELAALKNLAENLKLSDSVIFSGLIDYNKLPLYYNAADVCIFPSYYESFGLVPLESLACGTPVVATDVGDLKNIIIPGKTGYIVSKNTPQNLAEKIDILLSDKFNNNKNTDYIRNSIERFGWQYIAQSIEREFDNLALNLPVQVHTI